MKKQNLIFSALFLTLTTMPTSIFAVTVSGTVLDFEGKPAINANIYTINSKNETKTVARSDMDGRFEVDIPKETKLKITYANKEKIIEPGENLNIKFSESMELGGVTAKNKMEGEECFSSEAEAIEAIEKERAASGYRRGYSNDDKIELSPDTPFLTDAYAIKEKKGKAKPVGDKYICVPNECVQDYEVKDGACVHKECSNKEKKDLNADEAKFENGKCVVVTCKNKYHLNTTTNKCEENKCPTDEEDWDGTKCVQVRCTKDQAAAVNAKYGKWENDHCVPEKCLDDKNFKLENGSCIASNCPEKELEKINATSGHMENGRCIPSGCKENYSLENGACVNADILAEKQKAYDEAKAKEQSTENKLLGGLTTAATGIGGMQALQGLAEQDADEDAMADMTAYIETMRCTYGDGKQVKAGPDEIELPGANDAELMKLRAEYLALAADLKERKEALGMKPGIESELIMDRTQTGLYDDENVGITSGNYASIYRAMMLGSEKDQAKIDDAAKTSSNRVKYGAIAAGAGVVGGIVGNQLINGKSKDAKKDEAGENVKALEKEQETALNDLKKCLKDAGIKDTDKLEFKNFYPSVLSVKNINCRNNLIVKDADGTGLIRGQKPNNLKAQDMFTDSTDAHEIFMKMLDYIDIENVAKMVGYYFNRNADINTEMNNIENKIKSSMDDRQKKFDEAKKKDEESKSNALNKILDNVDLSGIAGGGAQQ